MNDDMDMKDSLVEEEGSVREVAPWLPRLVVTVTLAGFVALAWYAYRTGTQSIKDGELLIVEADKTPIKEKPEDPGGMKFPNQDKTIFETFANNPQVPPKVERVMPSPEEPIARQLDTSDTKTWVNEKLKQTTPAAPAGPAEQMIGQDAASAPLPEPAKDAQAMLQQKPSPVDPKKYEPNANIVSYTMDKAPPAKDQPAAKAVEEKPAEAKPAAESKPAPKEEAKPAKAGGNVKVQLGAYRSEKEAQTAFDGMKKKLPALSGKTPIVVRADLGDKGIYYRLRLGGFASDADAKGFCKDLTAKGQACIIAH